jgi:Tol biopolymer transport system component
MVSWLAVLALVVPMLLPGPADAAFGDDAAIGRTWTTWDSPVHWGIASRTWMFGYDYTAALYEEYQESPGGMRLVQYFDKSRMEITHPSGDDDHLWHVTNGLLATELISGRMQTGDNRFVIREPARVNVAGDPAGPTGPTYATFSSLLDAPPLAEGSTIVQRINRAGAVVDDPAFARYEVEATLFVPETGHRIAGPFVDFMWSSGVLRDWATDNYYTAQLFENPFYVVGFPITEAYWTRVMVGGTYHDVLAQCFERRCLTYTPENPPEWRVEAGNVGQHYYQWRYGHLPQPTGLIAYTKTVPSASTDAYGNIHVVAPDGTNDRNLTGSSGRARRPALSPDGSQVAFENTDDDWEIYVTNVDGTDLRRLTFHPGPDYFPAWSPDGSHIAYVTHDVVDGGGFERIWSVRPDGTGHQVLSPGYRFSWSPDGAQVAVLHNDGQFHQIYAVDADGSNFRQVSHGDTYKRLLGWTPDGEWITFGEISGYVHVVRPDGTGQHQLWDQAIHTSSELAWSPNGLLVAFISSSEVLSVMNADGTGLVELPAVLYPNYPFVWSPDGNYIAYTSGGFSGSPVHAVRVVNVAHPEWPQRSIAHGDHVDWSVAP